MNQSFVHFDSICIESDIDLRMQCCRHQFDMNMKSTGQHNRENMLESPCYNIDNYIDTTDPSWMSIEQVFDRTEHLPNIANKYNGIAIDMRLLNSSVQEQHQRR
jgi:hypothetical protein